MPTELEIIYTILAVQAIGMLLLTGFYYIKRLSIEEERTRALTQQRDNLASYYDQRLSIEKAKLEVEQQKLALRNER